MSSQLQDIIVTLLLVVAPAGQNAVTVVASAITKVITNHPKIVVLDQNAGKPSKANAIHQIVSTPPKEHDFTEIPPGANFKPGELIVCFALRADGTERTIRQMNRILASLGGGFVKARSRLCISPPEFWVGLPRSLTVKQALVTYNRSKEILYARPIYLDVYIAPPTFTKPAPKPVPSRNKPIVLRPQSPRLRSQHFNRTRKTIPLSRPRSHRGR